jgi:hypothetical protein
MGGLSPIMEPAEAHPNSSCAQKKKSDFVDLSGSDDLMTEYSVGEIVLRLGIRQGDT